MLFQFKIQLLEITDPEVWRRLVVPAHFSFHQFNTVIQSSFGWCDMHLYEFSPKGLGSYPIITRPDPQIQEVYQDSTRLTLNQYFKRKGTKLIYTYDYGDCWEHLIQLEDVLQQPGEIAVCTDGVGACPPEDVGGPHGYIDFKETVKDPSHKDYAATREWALVEEGEEWDPYEFDAEQATEDIEWRNKHYL